MDLDFGDVLTEDWIPQAYSGSDTDSARARIAVLSDSPSQILPPARPDLDGHHQALAERTASDINKSPIKPANTSSKRSSKLRTQQQHSSSSVAQPGTIQYTRKDENARPSETELPWKKHLAQSRSSHGKPQDLFSPMGLERMFEKGVPAKPTPPTPSPVRTAAGSNSLDPPYPSSPPMTRTQQSRPPGPAYRLQANSLPRPSSAQDVHDQLAQLQLHEPSQPSSPSSDREIDYGSGDRSLLSDDAPGKQTAQKAVNGSLRLAGHFVTTRRGGASSEASFLRQSLSQLSTPQEQARMQQKQGAAVLVRDFASDRPSPSAIAPDQHALQPRSSGSPLKLFDRHDTYTKNRVARRISQFEEEQLARRGEGSLANRSDSSSGEEKSRNRKLRQRHSSFGVGELNGFQFSKYHENPARRRKASAGGAIQPRNRRSSSLARAKDGAAANTRTSPPTTQISPILKVEKRQKQSPHKTSQSKRRRTLTNGAASAVAPARPSSHLRQRTPSLAGQKRKDARYDDVEASVDPEVLSARRLLQPRRSGTARVPSTVAATLPPALALAMADQDLQADVEAATEALADGLAHVANSTLLDEPASSRKPSVTTADFFKEARMIMDHIRLRAFSRSKTGSNPSAAHLPRIDDPLLEETEDEFSRPPSREHRQPRADAAVPRVNSRVVSHLRKFEDQDDEGIAWTSSARSQPDSASLPAAMDDSVISEPPNIRILDRREPEPSNEEGTEHHLSERQQLSNAASSKRSIDTKSSGSRNTKTIIGPAQVSHLISEHIGRMTFDPNRQCWVRRSEAQRTSDATPKLDSDTTEDDALQRIPDLTVDEREERDVRPHLRQHVLRQTVSESEDAAMRDNERSCSRSAEPSAHYAESSTILTKKDTQKQEVTAQRAEQGCVERDADEETSTQAVEKQRDLVVTAETPTSQPATPSRLQVVQHSAEQMDPASTSLFYHMSPLPDFTFNQADESMNRDVNYVAKERGLRTLQEIEGQFSLAVEALVGKLTDLEPHEPYWDSLRQIALCDQNLLTLHMLDEFCSRIETLHASGNRLGQLNGIPPSVRHLSVGGNCLTNLTAWAHLPNLQYLDVSQNQIQDVRAFESLVHLRDLNVSGNAIESLTGILHLDGLLRLNLSKNRLSQLDFTTTNLRRLTHLNVQDNQVSSVKSLDQLISLQSLRADGNCLHSLPAADTALRELKLMTAANNDMETVDLELCPELQALNVDGNPHVQILGLEQSSLRRLWWRATGSKTGVNNRVYDLLEDCKDLQILALSGQRLQKLKLPAVFLNLHVLELAGCGLESLQGDLGHELPNVRQLNLNNNALHDLRPLIGMRSLEKLYVAGNRLARLRLTTMTLGKLSSMLHEVDCRRNPVTVGFYSEQTHGPHGHEVVIHGSDYEQANDMEMEGYECKHLLPSADAQVEAQHRREQDATTLMKRQVYEILMGKACPKLRRLDGLDFSHVATTEHDSTIDRLIELGVLRRR